MTVQRETYRIHTTTRVRTRRDFPPTCRRHVEEVIIFQRTGEKKKDWPLAGHSTSNTARDSPCPCP